ncbi:GNAT family N-acetyltransferase [Cellulomonas composti]|uniref:N-acetyltransferase n=1 Tax=Cellulomonas composti TaxID=266130 RepID=A0A511JEG5_9CELL|nr:N-acetyltransferase [Cellulomonas composti]GEL96362.1 N-acetyltransferase [Cellulomonas composti]
MDRTTAVTVRRATPADVDALAALAAVTFPLACPPDSTPADQAQFVAAVLSVERFAQYVADEHRTVLLAHDEQGPDAPAGYAMLVAGEPTDPDVQRALTLRPTIELSKLYVHPDRHRGGVASALFAACLEDAGARGAVGMWLGVNQRNSRAQGFYTHAGFVRVGTKHFQVGARLEDDFVLERPLHPHD